jgi:hypothetical protein
LGCAHRIVTAAYELEVRRASLRDRTVGIALGTRADA